MAACTFPTLIPQQNDGMDVIFRKICMALASGSFSSSTVDLVTAVQTANFTAVAQSINPVDVTAGSVIVTPPASPVSGTWFWIVDATAGSSANIISVDFTTDKVNGLSTTYDFTDISHAGNKFVYINSTVGWLVAI